MADPLERLQTKLSHNHRRVISIRMRVLEESCLHLLDLFHDLNLTLTTRSALPQEKAREIRRLVEGLRKKISQTKSELGLQRARMDAGREAGALVAAMTVNVEELHPDYLKGYGPVPESLALYLEIQISEFLWLLHEIQQALGNSLTVVSRDGH